MKQWDVLARERLAQARHEAGLTQSELARRVGRMQSWVAKVEGGNYHLRLGDLMAIAAAFGTPVHKLVERLTTSKPVPSMLSRNQRVRARARESRVEIRAGGQVREGTDQESGGT